MNKIRIFILISSLVLIISECVAQEYWELETVIPPEVSHFKVGLKSDVGSTGALNISIPLLTVPGRGGLDFPISISYSAGIKTRQQASWVGLGWMLDLGSVVRDVHLLPDYDSVRNEKTDHDYPDNYQISSHAVSGNIFQADTNHLNPPKFILETTNAWKVSVIMKTFSGLRSISWTNGHPDTIRSYDSVYYAGGSWVGPHIIIDNQPHNGFLDSNRQRTFRDIEKFIVTSPDGVRYIFGVPLRSEDRMGFITFEFISNWRLTAILSNDFVDGGGDSLNPMDVNETGCKGSWVCIKYRPTENMRLRKYTNPNLLMQVTYPDTIFSPTHMAVFYTKERYDIGYIIPEPYDLSGTDYPINAYEMNVLPRQLDSLKLFERFNKCKLRNIGFLYAKHGQQRCETTTPVFVNSVRYDTLGKLTLQEIIPFDSSGTIKEHSYKFEYHKFNPPYFIGHQDGYPDYMPPSEFTSGWKANLSIYYNLSTYLRYRTDRFGFLYGMRTIQGEPNELSYECARSQVADSLEVFSTNGAVAYSLNKITYPTGAYEKYEYEGNNFESGDKSTANWGPGTESLIATNGNGLDPSQECGIRVKKKTIYTTSVDSNVISYSYGLGHLSAPPVFAWRRATNQFFRSLDRGRNVVEYEYIKVQQSDSSKVKRTFYRPNCFVFNKQRKIISKLIWYEYSSTICNLVIETSNDWKRGNLLKEELINSTNKIIRSIDNSYNFLIKDSTNTYYTDTTNHVITVYYTTMYSGLVLKNTQIDTMYDQSGNNPFTKTSSYVYTLKGFPRVTTEFNSDGRMRKSVTDYMLPDSVSYSGVALDMYNKNMYSSVKAKRLFQDDTLKNYTEYNYKVFDQIWLKRIYIDKKYQWRDVNLNNVVDSGELLTTATVDSLDNYGNPLIVTDPNGVKSYFTWHQNSKLASKTKFNQKVSYTYNPFHQVRSIIDENSNETRYIYDNFWRLRQIIGPDGKILKEYQYNYKQ